MSNYDKYEEEINIFTLFWFVLSKWRSILIVAIIGLVLGAGYAVVSSGGDEGPGATTEVMEETSEYAVDKQVLDTVIVRKESLAEYVANAAIMDINPYEAYKSSLAYVITGDETALLAVDVGIESLVYDGSLFRDLEAIGPYGIQELTHLVDLKQKKYDSIIIDETAKGQTAATISMLTRSEEEAQILLDQIEKSVNAYLDTLVNENVITNYQKISKDMIICESEELAQHQHNARSNYFSAKDGLDGQIQYMEKYEMSDIGEDVKDTNNMQSVLKKGVVGIVVGVVVMILAWSLVYFVSDKLFVVTDCERRFKTKSLGSVVKYRKHNALDLWIRHKIDGLYSRLSVEEQRKIVILNIKKEIEKNPEINVIHLISTQGEKMLEAQEMKAELEKIGCFVNPCRNIIGCVEEVERLTTTEGVVIVEDKFVSSSKLVGMETAILNRYTENVLGMVIVGNK